MSILLIKYTQFLTSLIRKKYQDLSRDQGILAPNKTSESTEGIPVNGDEDDFDKRLETLRQKIEGDRAPEKNQRSKDIIGDFVMKNYMPENEEESHIPLFINGVEAPNLGDLDFGEIPHFVGFQ